jgi:hypothetical protein
LSLPDACRGINSERRPHTIGVRSRNLVMPEAALAALARRRPALEEESAALNALTVSATPTSHRPRIAALRRKLLPWHVLRLLGVTGTPNGQKLWGSMTYAHGRIGFTHAISAVWQKNSILSSS